MTILVQCCESRLHIASARCWTSAGDEAVSHAVLRPRTTCLHLTRRQDASYLQMHDDIFNFTIFINFMDGSFQREKKFQSRFLLNFQ